jgi:pyruvate formate lyase activating enzyme
LPEAVVSAALRSGCKSISYTYTEPTIYLEYALDTAVLAKDRGLFNNMITNGYTTPEVIASDLKGTIHAANIDLKAFTENFYRKLCSARLAPVLDAIQTYHDNGIWIEITTLLIPGENDSDEEMRDIASFISSINPDIPWHISRYYPRYKYDSAPPTPIKTIERAREIGLSEGLNFVYSGNVMGHVGENTYCPNCKKLIIARKGYFIERIAMKGQACEYCSHIIPGRFQ